MASIAYITNKNMIEFHRLNGNTAINFWKPSNSKKISDFNRGDFLFFLAKGTEKGLNREKGIIGYGKLERSHTATFAQMWAKYQTQNGYRTKATLYDAITKITKSHKMPNSLNCLYLEEVVFFQAPVYLSEIDVEISNKIESYFYLDKDDMLNTSKILEVANSIGIDMWSSMFVDEKKDVFLKDAQLNAIYNIYEKIKSSFYTTYDMNRLNRFIQKIVEDDIRSQIMNNSKTEYLTFSDDRIEICLPCIINSNDFSRKLQYVIGHYLLYKGYIEKSEYHNEIDICIVFNQMLSDDIKEILAIQSIQYKEKLADC